jgi:hypothetical protein
MILTSGPDSNKRQTKFTLRHVQTNQHLERTRLLLRAATDEDPGVSFLAWSEWCTLSSFCFPLFTQNFRL